MQVDDNVIDHPMSFYSKKLDKHQQKYSVVEKEALSLLYMNIVLRRFLHNHGNIATEGSPKPGLCPTLISNDFKGSL